MEGLAKFLGEFYELDLQSDLWYTLGRLRGKSVDVKREEHRTRAKDKDLPTYIVRPKLISQFITNCPDILPLN